MTSVKKVTISLPTEVLQVVDEYARSEDQSRSFVIKEAIESYLKEEVERRTVAEAAQIYAQIEKSDRQLSEEFLSISSETLSSLKRKDRDGSTS
ncbi:hypothetical protein HKBW3S42_00811 [Candidatus Hakubella thermalkaliphila]|nr:hypothetical protein HKBW3S09_00270 [Candidatus Hakubella thermalkaliphila]GFP30697.1 hypothetical protein HKBW3S34_01617 [Candidatus Hakubella thermalkaliphila]GFP32507.1 hypothetical protein HKBW3S42_00811 [Candidatus Hakubella thermalkaliphila]GFP37294.1 hypothetical protein HKBW3S44_00974 [Candidatus Hakubella thermalkaliphila]